MDNVRPVSVEGLVVEHLDVWASAVRRRSTAGRGASKKVELYGVKRLRELILELAVRGLMVPQDASDEPASVLLKRITAEKAKLVKEGKIKKEKALPPISDDEKPFGSPQGWEWVRLDQLFNTIVDCPHSTPKFTDTGYLALDTNSFKQGFLLPHKFRFVSEQTWINRNARLTPQHKDIVFAREGSVGESVVIPEDLDCCLGQRVMLFRPSNILNPFFLRLTISSPLALRVLLSLHKGIGAKHVNVLDMKNYAVCLPPAPEQHRIVAKVDELMALCDQLEQHTESSLTAHQTLVETLLGALTGAADHAQFALAWQRLAAHFDVLFTTEESIDQLKQAILQLAVMGKLVKPEFEDTNVAELVQKIYAEQLKKPGSKNQVGALENEYERALVLKYDNRVMLRARFICDFITKGTTPSGDELMDRGDIPFLKVYNIVDQTINFDYKPIFISTGIHNGKLKRSKVYPGDVVMNIVGPPLGKVAVIPDQYSEWNINQALAVFRPLGGVLNRYLYFVLSAQSTLASVLSEVKGTAGQDNLSLEQCRDLLIPLPSMEEQHRIVTKVDELMALCDQLKARLTAVQATQVKLADAVAAGVLV